MEPELAAIVSDRKVAYDRCDVALDHGRMPKWSPNSDYLDFWMMAYKEQTSLLSDYRVAKARLHLSETTNEL